jgi:DNA polymerase-3 subunit delta
MENIYTFIGEDENYNLIKIDEKAKELQLSNLIKFDLSENGVFSLLEELNTSSFFEPNKVIVAYNVKEDLDDDRLIKYLLNPNPSNYLFISIKNDKYKIYESLKKNSLIIENNVLKPEEFLKYVLKEAKRLGYNIDNDAASELAKRSLENYTLLNNNLDKIFSYKYDSKNINLNDINQLITKDLDDNIFDLVEEVIKNNKNKAYDIYKELLKKNTDESLILGSLIYKFKEMAMTKVLLNDKCDKAQIAEILNVKEGRAYYMIKNVSNVRSEDLIDKLNRLLDIDTKSKTGLVNLSQELEMFILL